MACGAFRVGCCVAMFVPVDLPFVAGPTYMISAINFQPGPALPYTPCGTIFTHVASGQAPVTFIAPLQAGKAELPQAEQFGITTGVLLVVLGGGVALLRYCQYRGERARAAANAAKSAEDYSALN